MEDTIEKDNYDEKFQILGDDLLSCLKNDEILAKPDKTLYDHTKELLQQLDTLKNMGYVKDDRIIGMTEKSIIFHDIGKINKCFQERIRNGSRFDDSKEISHNIISFLLLDKNRMKPISDEDFSIICHAVLNHHMYVNNLESITQDTTINIANRLMGEIKNEYEIEYPEGSKTIGTKKLVLPKNLASDRLRKKIIGVLESGDAMRVKGLLHRCDYSASSGASIEYEPNFLNESLERLQMKWSNKRVGEDKDGCCTPNKDSNWNELQKFCKDNEDKNIIVVAQTGMGKTEAGLRWIGDQKGFFILPLRTAINAMYDRIRIQILEDHEIERKLAMHHSESLDYYVGNLTNNIETDMNVENVERKSSIVEDVFDYYANSKQLSLPLNIATMDSIFNLSHRYKSYEAKLATLSYSKIVVDEIQAYDVDLLATMLYGMKLILDVGGKLAILTATLPPYVRDLLKKYVFEGRLSDLEEGKFIDDKLDRHHVQLVDSGIDVEKIKDLYTLNAELKKPNKILVVCNTIKVAQDIYHQLKSRLPDENINILHSRFIRKERAEKEREILDFGRTFDKDGNLDIRNGIWISTSIVEASLDIDFDYLFTELVDLNSLFQRFGRVNRKGVKDISEANCYVYIGSDIKHFDETLFSLSRNALKAEINEDNINISGDITDSSDPVYNDIGVMSESKKIEIIENTLTTENLIGSSILKNFKEKYNYLKANSPYTKKQSEVKVRDISSVDLMPYTVFESNEEEILRICRDYEKCVEEIKSIKGMSNAGNSGHSYEDCMKKMILLKNKFKDYVVSVPEYYLKEYIRTRNLSDVQYTGLGSRYKVAILNCTYDDAGFSSSEKNDKEDDAFKGIFF